MGQSAVPAGLSDVIQVTTGNYHTCALKRNGTVACWGALPPRQSARREQPSWRWRAGARGGWAAEPSLLLSAQVTTVMGRAPCLPACRTSSRSRQEHTTPAPSRATAPLHAGVRCRAVLCGPAASAVSHGRFTLFLRRICQLLCHHQHLMQGPAYRNKAPSPAACPTSSRLPRGMTTPAPSSATAPSHAGVRYQPNFVD